jgi:hypothetical protein
LWFGATLDRTWRSRKIFDTAGEGGRRLGGHTMSRTIVCGVDQSDAAEAVANTARRLANRLNAVRLVGGSPLLFGPVLRGE